MAVSYRRYLAKFVQLLFPSQVTGGKMPYSTILEVYRHKVVRRLRSRAVACRMILDVQLRCIRHNAQIAIFEVVVVLEHHLVSLAVRLLDDLWRAERFAVCALSQTRQGVSAVATNHVWDLSAIRSSPGETLIVMSMAGEKCMGPDTDLFANSVNL